MPTPPRIGEVFITATGSAGVITAEHLAVMRDGAILANAGHFDVEIDVRALSAMAVAVDTDVRPHADAYELPDGRRLLLLAEGRVVNLVAADGHPPEVMDLAFGIEALSLAWLAPELAATEHAAARRPPGPGDIDAEAARLVLTALGTRLDTLTEAQQSYLASWRLGSYAARQPRRRGRAARSDLGAGVAARVVAGGAYPVAAAVGAPLPGGVGPQEPADTAVGAAGRRDPAVPAGQHGERVGRELGQRGAYRVGRGRKRPLVAPRPGIIPAQDGDRRASRQGPG